MYTWHRLTGKERRTIMIAKNLKHNYHLTWNNRERIVLLAVC